MVENYMIRVNMIRVKKKLAVGEPEDEELELADDCADGYPREPRQNITLDFDVLAALKADPEDMLVAIPASQTRRVLRRIKNYEWVVGKLYRKATLHSARREVPPILERLAVGAGNSLDQGTLQGSEDSFSSASSVLVVWHKRYSSGGL